MELKTQLIKTLICFIPQWEVDHEEKQKHTPYTDLILQGTRNSTKIKKILLVGIM